MSLFMHFMRTRQPRLTLGQFIALCFAGLALLLLVLLSIFYTGSRRTILLASQQLMSQASRRINERLDGHLGEAERVVASLESQAALGRIDSGRPETIETATSCSPTSRTTRRATTSSSAR